MSLKEIKRILSESLIDQGFDMECAEALAQQQTKRIRFFYRNSYLYISDRNPDLFKQIKQDYQSLQRKNTHALAKKYGVSVRTVYRYLKKL